MDKIIYTHDEAADILEMFEKVLDKYNIKIPSPEDDERDPENDAKLYGTVYADLLDEVEDKLIDICIRRLNVKRMITGMFSGSR